MSIWQKSLTTFITAAVLGAAAPAAAQSGPASPWPEDWLNPTLNDPQRWHTQRMNREHKQRFERQNSYTGVRDFSSYVSQRNPLSESVAVLKAGATLYAAECARCHGKKGRGGGDAGLALDPSPALLKHLSAEPGSVDAYLLWTVAEGGMPFGSAMPAYKDRLSREQIWQIISYMRAGFRTTTVGN